jgi:selenium metabolism protein YedF
MYTNLVLLVGSSVLGRGDDQQGSSLMNSLFYSISRLESVPATIILINSGVFLVSEGSPILEYLKSLEKRGVEIISSASCLEYYNLQDKLMVGYSSNMYSITEKMFTAARLISI